MCERQKTVGKQVGEQLEINRTCLYSPQLFHQLFRVGKLASKVWTIGKRVVTVNQPKHALYWRLIFCVTLHKMADASQDELEVTFKFIGEVHNCRLCRTFHAYKDTKNKQKKMEELADKLSFVQTFLFFHRFLFLLFCFTALALDLRECHCTKSAILPYCHIANYRVWRVKGRVCQLFEIYQNEFANLSLSCEGRLDWSWFCC